MTSQETINGCNLKMQKAFEVFNVDLGSLRTGRANVSMLDIIKVDVYGQKMPISQLATISTPEPRLITVHAGFGTQCQRVVTMPRSSPRSSHGSRLEIICAAAHVPPDVSPEDP